MAFGRPEWQRVDVERATAGISPIGTIPPGRERIVLQPHSVILLLLPLVVTSAGGFLVAVAPSDTPSPRRNPA